MEAVQGIPCFEKLLHATGGSAVAATEPTVEEKMRFAQHGQQGMVAGTDAFITFQGFLPFAVALTMESRSSV